MVMLNGANANWNENDSHSAERRGPGDPPPGGDHPGGATYFRRYPHSLTADSKIRLSSSKILLAIFP